MKKWTKEFKKKNSEKDNIHRQFYIDYGHNPIIKDDGKDHTPKLPKRV